MRADLNKVVGIAFAIFSTFSWALNFVSPYVTGGYTNYDFILIRFLLSGIFGLIFVTLFRDKVAQLQATHVLAATVLGNRLRRLSGLHHGGASFTPAR